jgi:hypothetical protein
VQRNQSTQTRKASCELRFRSEDHRSIACLGSGRKEEREKEGEKEGKRVLFMSAVTNESDDESTNHIFCLVVGGRYTYI